ncbi:hypothetical protein DBV15_10781, partial [Temnothorax longispinosus]
MYASLEKPASVPRQSDRRERLQLKRRETEIRDVWNTRKAQDPSCEMHGAWCPTQPKISPRIFTRMQRLIAVMAEINERKEKEKEREMAMRLYANNEAADTFPVFTVQGTDAGSVYDDTRSWLSNERIRSSSVNDKSAPRNRKPVIEPVHRDDPASPIYYAKHSGLGRRSIAGKHLSEFDHAKIESDARPRRAARRSRRVVHDESKFLYLYIPRITFPNIKIDIQNAANVVTQELNFEEGCRNENREIRLNDRDRMKIHSANIPDSFVSHEQKTRIAAGLATSLNNINVGFKSLKGPIIVPLGSIQTRCKFASP